MEERLFCQKQGSIATIMMNRPKAMNSFNQILLMIYGFTGVERDKTIRVVVLTGNGKVFSAGGDLFHIVGLKILWKLGILLFKQELW